jgi:hypothetical protein
MGDSLINVRVTFNYPRRTWSIGNAKFTKADEGMFYIYFDQEVCIAYPLRDIFHVEIEPVKS